MDRKGTITTVFPKNNRQMNNLNPNRMSKNEHQRDWLGGRYSKRVNEIIKKLSNNEELVVLYISSNMEPYQEPINSEHFINEKNDLLQRIEMLENKVVNLEYDIAEMKSKN